MDKKTLEKINKSVIKAHEEELQKRVYPPFYDNYYTENSYNDYYNPKKAIKNLYFNYGCDENEMPKSIIREINNDIKDKSKFIIESKNLYAFFYETNLQEIIDTFINDKYSINYYLYKIREIKKLKNEDIAEKSNLDVNTIDSYFKGGNSKRNPSRDALMALSFAFELSIEDLNYLLKISGRNEIYLKNKRDIIIAKCIIDQKNIYETNKILFLNDEKKLGSINESFDWLYDDINTLKRKIKLREDEIKRLNYSKDSDFYKEYEKMKIRLKELEKEQE